MAIARSLRRVAAAHHQVAGDADDAGDQDTALDDRERGADLVGVAARTPAVAELYIITGIADAEAAAAIAREEPCERAR